jgi:hypothetical protein
MTASKSLDELVNSTELSLAVEVGGRAKGQGRQGVWPVSYNRWPCWPFPFPWWPAIPWPLPGSK